MRLADSLQRSGLAVVGVFAAVVLAAGCSSSSNGTPDTSGAAPTVGGSTSAPTSVSDSTSSDDGGSGGTGGSASKFCSDFANVDPSDFTGNGGDLSAALKIYDKLVADAPAEIKDDITLIRDLIKSSTSGGPTASQTQKLQAALTHLGTYAASHCAGN